MRLYESADLRDELTDDEVDPLLKWAEAEVARLDQSAPDDETFDAQVVTLMDLIKGVNRYAGRQGQASAQAADPLPGDIAAKAAAIGHAANPAQIAAAGTGDPASTISALTGLLTGSTETPQPAPNQSIHPPTGAPQSALDAPIHPPTEAPNAPTDAPTDAPTLGDTDL
jgi:hypothetical protein